jgi:hypothetical protein
MMWLLGLVMEVSILLVELLTFLETWFHDGMTTGSTSINDGKIGRVGQPNLHKCRNKKLCLAIYAQRSL